MQPITHNPITPSHRRNESPVPLYVASPPLVDASQPSKPGVGSMMSEPQSDLTIRHYAHVLAGPPVPSSRVPLPSFLS